MDKKLKDLKERGIGGDQRRRRQHPACSGGIEPEGGLKTRPLAGVKPRISSCG